MTDRYLLDKSAAYRTHVPAVRIRLEPLMERGLLARCGLTDLEFGVSARSREDHRALGISRRDALEYLTTPDTVWERAWEVQEELTEKGLHRSVKVPDLIIAAIAEHHRVCVMHYDRDFDRIAAITGQTVEWAVPAGSV
ncbi:MAG: PIN domain nuclease [Mycobacterium sp.]